MGNQITNDRSDDDIQTPVEASKGTNLSVNVEVTALRIREEVAKEFVTSKEEVYREGLRSLTHQENLLLKQANEVKKDLERIEQAKQDLAAAFVAGKLISMDDVRECVETGDVTDGKIRRALKYHDQRAYKKVS